MQGSTKRADKRRSIENRALDAATDMIREGGPDALTMAGLADELALSVGGLYRYYPSKGAILVGLEKRAIASYSATQERILLLLEPRLRRAPPREAALARLLAASSAYLEHARLDPLQHGIMTQMLAVPEPLLDEREVREVETHVQPILERSTALMRAAEEVKALSSGAGGVGGVGGSAEVRTFVLWATLQGADQFRKRDRLLPPHLHSRALADAAIESLLLGWGARATDLASARKRVPRLG